MVEQAASLSTEPAWRRALPLATGLAFLAFALLLPGFGGRFWTAIGVSVFFWAAFSGSWNIIGGYAGQFSLGHAAFFGIGAYASAWVYTALGLPPALGIIGGVALAAGAAWALGWVIFRYRLHGTYFAIGTLALSEMLRVMAGYVPWFGGNGGIPIPLAQDPPWWLFQFQPVTYYYVFLTMTLAIMALSRRIERNRLGYQLAAIRDSEDVARALGISPDRLKLRAFVLSAALAAPIGTFYAQYLMFVEPVTFIGILVAIQVVLPTVIGGIGTVFGPLIGALILTLAIELSNSFALRPGVNLAIYGGLLMVFSLALPRGLGPLIARLWERR